MSKQRQRRRTTLFITFLLLSLIVAGRGYPAVEHLRARVTDALPIHLPARLAGILPNGSRAETAENAAELDREVQEIGRLIRERQQETPTEADRLASSALAGVGQPAWPTPGESPFAAAAPASAGPPVWPAPGYFEITSAFGSRVHPILKVPKLHAGLDIGAPEGADVVACLSGRVIAVGALPAYGQYIIIDHGGRLASVYAHLSAVLAQPGDQVERGAAIGRVGSTGRVTGSHLHFEVRHDGEPADPAAMLGQ